MRKYLSITTCFLVLSFNAIGQSISERKDSLRIENLKKNLPKSKGKDHIESMILLCEYYSDKTKAKNINAIDSIRYYGNKILNASKLINYKKGIAIGMLATAPDSLKEKIAQEAIQIGDEIKNDEVLGWAYSSLIRDMSPKAISNYQHAITHFNKAGKILRAAFINTWLCQIFFSTGENEKAFDCARENLSTLTKIQSPEFSYIYSQSLLWSYWNMAYIFKAAGDYEEAIKYIHKTEEVDRADNPKAEDWSLEISDIYAELGRYDSAHFYWNRFTSFPSWGDPNVGWRPGKKLPLNGLARIYAMNKQYEKAIEILKDNIVYFDSLLEHTTGNFQNAGNYGKMVASITLGAIYDSLKNYKVSLAYAKDGFYQAQVRNRRPEMMQASQLLSRAYHHLNNNDSAYTYLEKYVILKDSIQSKQFLLRIYNSKKEAEEAKKESRIGLLNRDNQIKLQQLKQEATFRNFLIAVFIAIVFAGLYAFRNIKLKRNNDRLKQEQKEQEWKLKHLESEKKHAELQQQALELEMQALRAQMNPHFIFNCLSSINRFIFKNDNKLASDYLTRFSRLIRMVLIHSSKKLIPLEDELEMLRLYLDLERLRFKDAFDYSITTTNIVDAGAIFIPPLLLQPFCENAVWHGLMHKESKGHLNIIISEVVSENEKVLHCTIEDDGVGREKAAEMKSKSAESEKSFGLKITTERLALLNQENNFSTFYKIEDMLNENNEVAGTRVQLKIRHKENIEEYA